MVTSSNDIRRNSPVLPINRLPESLRVQVSNHRRSRLDRCRPWLSKLFIQPIRNYNPRAITDPRICHMCRLRINSRYDLPKRTPWQITDSQFSSHCQTTRNGTVRTCGTHISGLFYWTPSTFSSMSSHRDSATLSRTVFSCAPHSTRLRLGLKWSLGSL